MIFSALDLRYNNEMKNGGKTYQYLAFVGVISIGNPSNIDVIRETHPIPVTVFDVLFQSNVRDTTGLCAAIACSYRYASGT